MHERREDAQSVPAYALAPPVLVEIVRLYAVLLRAFRQDLDRLNVYPVPDGDTGTNLCLTVDHVVDALEVAEPADVPSTITRAAVMGAHGSSGVILSQGLRGLTSVLADADGGPADLAQALQEAARHAYRAIADPVEGTILTVMRASGEAAAVQAARVGCTLAEVADAAAVAGWRTLERTPELLPALARAGVVDAGGKGYALFLDAAVSVITGRPPAHPAPTSLVAEREAPLEPPEAGHRGPKFEVMCRLEAPEPHVDELRRAWNDLGESVVIAGHDGHWRCHVHTDDVDAVLQGAERSGHVHDVKVTDLQRMVMEAAPEGTADQPVAVVAVVTGTGSQHIALLLGAARVVANAPSATPSTRQLLDAIEACQPSDVVIVVDDHNVVPVAEQAATLTGHAVHIVPTHGLVEVLEALSVHDRTQSAAQTAQHMLAAARALRWARIRPVVRHADTIVGRVAPGDWLAISPDGPVAAEPSALDAAVEAVTVLAEDDGEDFVVIRGQAASADDVERLRAHLRAAYPDAAVEVHDSAEPLVALTVAVRRPSRSGSAADG